MEMRGQVGNTDETIKLMPIFADLMTDFKLANPEKDTNGMFKDAIKIVQMRGKFYKPGTQEIDIKSIKDELDHMALVDKATKGQVNPTTLRQTVSMAGPLAKSMTADEIYYFGAELYNTMGHSKTGVALSSLAQQMLGGQMKESVAQNMEHYGFLNHNDVKYGKGGKVEIGSDGINNKEQFKKNPMEWFYEHLDKAGEQYKKEYDLTHKEKLSLADAKQNLLYLILGRATTQRLGSELDSGRAELINFANLVGKGMDSTDTAKTARAEDPYTGIQMFNSAFQDLIKSFGLPMVKPINDGIHQVVDAIHDLTKWANNPENRETVIMAEKAAAVIAGLLIGGGALFLLAAFGPILASSFELFAIGGIAYEAILFLTGSDGLTSLGSNLRLLAKDWQMMFGSSDHKPMSETLQSDGTILLQDGSVIRDPLANRNKLPVQIETAPLKPSALPNGTSAVKPSDNSLKKMSFNGETLNVHVVNGRDLVYSSVKSLSDGFTSAPSGGNSFDYRTSPMQPGVAMI
jgi:hypothetical protein